MKIVHLTNALRLNGTGHTNSTIDLAIEQRRRSHEVEMVCEESDDDTRRLLARHGIGVTEISGARNLRQIWASRFGVRRALTGAHVLHVHTVRSMLFASTIGPVRAWRRSVATIHNPHQRSVVVMYLARRIVTLSEVNRRHVRRLTGGLRRPVVVLNATHETPRLAPLTTVQPRSLPRHSILFVGALHRRKGLDVLIDALPAVLARVPDARLFVVGNRDDPAFETLAEERGVSAQVHFVGFCADPRAYMLSASVFVLPSRQEGFGNVITEARACRVPIVASRVGGIPEALSSGKAGVLVSPESANELADAMVHILLDDEWAATLRSATQIGLGHMRVSRAEREYSSVYRGMRPVSIRPPRRSA